MTVTIFREVQWLLFPLVFYIKFLHFISGGIDFKRKVIRRLDKCLIVCLFTLLM